MIQLFLLWMSRRKFCTIHDSMVPNCSEESIRTKIENISKLTKQGWQGQGVNIEEGMEKFGSCTSFSKLYLFFIKHGLF